MFRAIPNANHDISLPEHPCLRMCLARGMLVKARFPCQTSGNYWHRPLDFTWTTCQLTDCLLPPASPCPREVYKDLLSPPAWSSVSPHTLAVDKFLRLPLATTTPASGYAFPTRTPIYEYRHQVLLLPTCFPLLHITTFDQHGRYSSNGQPRP